ncbi:hypothetical protein AAHA92_24766 [Salvia divinorum]|uniref:Uncharacterized protein n=1 Tax=Salvia divinorum TaxID=28513 RepID=A0ABD1G9I0_SALDI
MRDERPGRPKRDFDNTEYVAARGRSGAEQLGQQRQWLEFLVWRLADSVQIWSGADPKQEQCQGRAAASSRGWSVLTRQELGQTQQLLA